MQELFVAGLPNFITTQRSGGTVEVVRFPLVFAGIRLRPLSQRCKSTRLAQPIHYVAVSPGEAPLQEGKLGPSYVTNVEVAPLGHHRGDAPIEALERVGSDQDAKAERPQTCSVYEDLHRARRALTLRRHVLPGVIGAGGEERRCLRLSPDEMPQGSAAWHKTATGEECSTH